MAHAEGMHRETRREQDAHPRAGLAPRQPRIRPHQPSTRSREPRHRRRPACQGRLHDSCTTTGKASTMKVRGKMQPISNIFHRRLRAICSARIRLSSRPGGQRARHRPRTCARASACAIATAQWAARVLPLRRASSRIATACGTPARISTSARSSASRSRPGGPLRAASCSAPARSFRLPRTGPSCRTRRAGRARCRAQGGLPACASAHPQPSQCQPCQPARATRCDGRCDIRRHVCLGARSGASCIDPAMRRISTTPAVSSAASSASTPQPAGVRHSRFMIAGSSR